MRRTVAVPPLYRPSATRDQIRRRSGGIGRAPHEAPCAVLAFVVLAMVYGIGAVLPDFQPQEHVRVLLDPAGHPFCLWMDG